jgi:hypothetical protein
MMAIPKSVLLRLFLEMRLVTELLTVPERVMVCLVCTVFLLCLVNRDTSQKTQRYAALKSRHGHVAKGRSFWIEARSLRGGRSPTPERGT